MAAKKIIVVPCIVIIWLKSIRGHGLGLGPQELKTHHQRLGPANHEKDHGHEEIHDADLLVIDDGHPLVKHRGPRGAFEAASSMFRDGHASGRPGS